MESIVASEFILEAFFDTAHCPGNITAEYERPRAFAEINVVTQRRGDLLDYASIVIKYIELILDVDALARCLAQLLSPVSYISKKIQLIQLGQFDYGSLHIERTRLTRQERRNFRERALGLFCGGQFRILIAFQSDATQKVWSLFHFQGHFI